MLKDCQVLFVLFLKNPTLIGHWWLMPGILASQEAEIIRIAVQGHPDHGLRPAGQMVLETLSQKYPPKRANKVTQVVAHLPRKCEALSSIPTTVKKQKINKNISSIFYIVFFSFDLILFSPLVFTISPLQLI
jgi:hypothetical protein